MICKLCLNEKPLLKKSHIIPNYLYDGLCDESNKMIFLKLKEGRKENYYTGIFDANILCRECDNELLSHLENYARNTIFSKNWHSKLGIEVSSKITDSRLESIIYKNLDYSKTKRFLLSLIWRASISKQPIFKNVNLGPHGEIIRKMILNDEPCPSDIYETAICILKPNPNKLYRSMIEPRKITEDGNTWYLIYINSLVFHFNISPINKQKLFGELKIFETGQMGVTILDGQYAETYFNALSGFRN
jgi:hypothetical protein